GERAAPLARPVAALDGGRRAGGELHAVAARCAGRAGGEAEDPGGADAGEEDPVEAGIARADRRVALILREHLHAPSEPLCGLRRQRDPDRAVRRPPRWGPRTAGARELTATATTRRRTAPPSPGCSRGTAASRWARAGRPRRRTARPPPRRRAAPCRAPRRDRGARPSRRTSRPALPGRGSR